MNLRERCEKLYNDLPTELGRYRKHEDVIDQIESFAREIHNEALEEVLAGIKREQQYREYRMEVVVDQDGSAVGACKEIAGYVRAMQNSHPISSAKDE